MPRIWAIAFSLAPLMQASTERLPHYLAADTPAAIALEEEPSRYWVLALITASAATWAMIFGVAKLLLAFI
jgi:hypothetical protein